MTNTGLGIDVDIQNHNAIQGAFSSRASAHGLVCVEISHRCHPQQIAEVQCVAALSPSQGVMCMRVVADRRYFLLLMGGLIALAWLTLWLWGQSPTGAC